MKKVFKSLRGNLLAGVILIVVVLLAINFFVDFALELGIEAAATKTLNVGVSVSEVDLSILGGSLSLENLLINNPPGYQHDKLLTLDKAKVKISTKSLLSDVIRINEINLDGIELVIEQRGISNNLNDVIKAIPAKPEDEKAPEEAKERPKKAGKKLQIDTLEIGNVTVKVKLLPIPGKADTVTLKLAPIRMTNLGEKEHLDTAVLSSKILVAIAEGVAGQGAGVLPQDVVGSMKGELERFKDVSGTLLDEGSKVLKEGKDLGREVTEGIKGLLKPKEE